MKYLSLLLAIIFTCSSAAVFARNNANNDHRCCKNDLSGGVMQAQTKKPLNKVIVTVYTADKKEKVVVTDNNGNYALNDLKPGMYRLVFEKEGYKKVVKEKVVIGSQEVSQLNVEMAENDDFRIIPGQLFFTDYN